MKTNRETYQMDMLNGSLLDKILLFALPLAASSILQQLFNSADVAVAGRFAGSNALAAVGGNAPVIGLFVNLFVGLSVGANVVVANYIGQGKQEKINEAIHAIFSIALLSGLFLLVVGQITAKFILVLIDVPKDVLPLATIYLRIYFIGMPFAMIYNFGAAILRSSGDSKRPLIYLTLSGILNVCLNLIFVILLHLSVVGVATATFVANVVTATLVWHHFCKEEGIFKLDPKKMSLHKEHVIQILKIGVPAGLQGIVFSLSNVCIQAAINGFGNHAIAGSSAAMNYEYFTFYVTSAFGQAAVTFTAQNYGAGRLDRCKKVLRYAMFLGILGTGVMCFIFTLFRYFFVGIYTNDPIDIKYALVRMIHVEMLEFMTCLYEITGGALRGMGRSLLPAILTVFGSCVLRLVWLGTVFQRFPTFEMLLNVYPITWTITSILVIGAYFIVRKQAKFIAE